MLDVALEKRLRRFGLLRTALVHLTPPESSLSDESVKDLLRRNTHLTTRTLARFVMQHHYGTPQPGGYVPVGEEAKNDYDALTDRQGIDVLDLWRRLDATGRDELVAYLREEV